MNRTDAAQPGWDWYEDEERGRRRRRLLLLLGFLLLLGAIVTTLGVYAMTRWSLTTLPGVGQMAKGLAPRYVYALTGVTAPGSVAVTPEGDRVYVVDTGERLVRVFTPEGGERARLVPPATTMATRMPVSVAVAPDGRFFVSDRMRVAIDMYTPAGGYIGAFRPEAVLDEPWQPLGLSFDGAGRLLVTDLSLGNHRILVFRTAGFLDTTLGEGEQGGRGLSFPYAATADAQGRTYVSDSNNAVVEVFSPEGHPLSTLSAADPKSGLGLPRGMAIDSLGRLHVADAATHSVSVFETGDRLRFLYSFGEIGTAGPELRYPEGIALDQRGRVYVADRGNNAVKVWSY